MNIINILDNDIVKIFIVLFVILQSANLINLQDILIDSDLKKNIYNLLLILLIIYYSSSSNMNNINIGLCIIISILIFKNLCVEKKNITITGGNNNIDDDHLINIQKEVLEDITETYDSDENDDYDAYGGNDKEAENDEENNNDEESDNDTMKNIDKELNIVYKEYLEQKKEADDKKDEFKDILVKNKIAKNIKKIEKTNEMDNNLKKLENLEKEYKKISSLMEGGNKDYKIAGKDFAKEVARIENIKKSVEKNKKLYDLNKDGKLDMKDMPDDAQIEKYKAEIDKVMEEENDLFNISEDSPILEEWSEAFANNFKIKKMPKNIVKDKKKVGGNVNNDLDELIGGFNELSNNYAQIQSF